MSSFATSRFSTLPLGQARQSGAEIVSNDAASSFEITDETLIEGVKVGDSEALSFLFRRFVHLVRNIGEKILRDRAEADDLVQDVFLYIHRKSALFDRSKGSARSWIVQVAYTQAFLRRRHLKSHGFYLSAIEGGSPESAFQSYSGAEYDQSAEGLFGRNNWRKALETLSEEQRETLRLHFFEGYTFAEIAEKLKQTHTNVRHHYYRGLEKLRRQLSSEEWNERSST